MKKLLALFIGLVSVSGFAQSYQASYGAVADQVSQANVLSNLAEFESFGVKYRGTPAQANALQWLKDKYLSYGFTASQIVEDPFSYAGSTCKNLVVTKTGTTYPNTYVIIGGHYDTVNGPGANDNGSGTSVMLEIARLLVNVPTEYSIRFIHFAGEEDGLIGSQHYVNNVVNSTNPKMDIRLVLNIDQVGGVAGGTNSWITCERDQSNPTSNNAASNAVTQQLMNCVSLYSTLNPVLSYAYGSDYVPFENNGEVITGLYETYESTVPHTSNDLLLNLDPGFVYQVARASVGAALHFAVACTSCNLMVNDAVQNTEITLHPNPANGFTTVQLPMAVDSCSLVDLSGKIVRRYQRLENGQQLDLMGIPPGEYLVIFSIQARVFTRKLLVH